MTTVSLPHAMRGRGITCTIFETQCSKYMYIYNYILYSAPYPTPHNLQLIMVKYIVATSDTMYDEMSEDIHVQVHVLD